MYIKLKEFNIINCIKINMILNYFKLFHLKQIIYLIYFENIKNLFKH